MNPKAEIRERISLLLYALVAVADDLPATHTPNLVTLIEWFSSTDGTEKFSGWFFDAQAAAKKAKGRKATRLVCALAGLKEAAFHAGILVSTE